MKLHCFVGHKGVEDVLLIAVVQRVFDQMMRPLIGYPIESVKLHFIFTLIHFLILTRFSHK